MTRHRSIASIAMCVVLACAGVHANAQVLATYDFEDGTGGPDAQGWRLLHRLQSSEAVFGHVEDATGFGPPLSPLAGAQSFWFGLSADDPRTCGWEAPPGYGSLWSEQLRSVPFSVSGDVSLSFLIEMGIEQGYDNLRVEYMGSSGDWELLQNYSCTQTDCLVGQENLLIPAAEHSGNLSIRFFFSSEFVGDARDRILPFNINVFGVLLDDIVVSDVNGVVDAQDFEGELVGDQATSDGSWTVEENLELPHGGILIDGNDVLQLHTPPNTSHVWGFFDDSPHDYGCAGHPEQLVVDENHALVRSPRIDLSRDIYGNEIIGEADSILVEFDVYAELDQSNSRRFEWRAVSIDVDCVGQKSVRSLAASGAPAGWSRQALMFTPPAGTDEIEVELGIYQPSFFPSWCTSHAPLYDNVTVTRFGGISTSADPATSAGGLFQLNNRPNPFNPSTTIEFVLELPAPQVEIAIFDARGRVVRTLLDEARPAGPQNVEWNGRDDAGRAVASGVYLYELRVGSERSTRKMLVVK